MKIPREIKIKKIGEDKIYVEGKLGIQKARIKGVEVKDDRVEVTTRKGEGVIKEMIEGVTKGYKAKMIIAGVGYKARVEGKKMKLSVGYKDEKEVDIKEKVEMKVEGNTIIARGTMLEEIGEMVSKVEKVRAGRKDKYKGKGIVVKK